MLVSVRLLENRRGEKPQEGNRDAMLCRSLYCLERPRSLLAGAMAQQVSRDPPGTQSANPTGPLTGPTARIVGSSHSAGVIDRQNPILVVLHCLAARQKHRSPRTPMRDG